MRGPIVHGCVGRQNELNYCIEQADRLINRNRNIVVGVLGPTFIGRKTFCKMLYHALHAKYPDKRIEVKHGEKDDISTGGSDITIYWSLVKQEHTDVAIRLGALQPRDSYALFMNGCEKAKRYGISYKDFTSNLNNIETCDPLAILMCAEYIDHSSDVLSGEALKKVLL